MQLVAAVLVVPVVAMVQRMVEDMADYMLFPLVDIIVGLLPAQQTLEMVVVVVVYPLAPGALG